MTIPLKYHLMVFGCSITKILSNCSIVSNGILKGLPLQCHSVVCGGIVAIYLIFNGIPFTNINWYSEKLIYRSVVFSGEDH